MTDKDFDLDDMLASILGDAKPTIIAGETKLADVVPNIPPEVERTPAAMNAHLTKEPATLAEAFDDSERKALNSLLTPVSEGQTDAFPAAMPKADTPFTDTPDRTDYALPELTMPEFTTDEIAKAIDLRNFATMTVLNTKRWHAKVKDRQASKNAANATGADESAFETRKHLLAGADELLKAIHKSIDTARAKYYEMTLPWTTTGLDDQGRRSGARIMPNTNFFEFITEMGNCKAAMTAALDKFVPAYPLLIEEAKKNLKGSFDISEYPNADSIRSHFDLSFDFQPIPQGGDFKGLPDAQCQALADALEGKTKKMMENAMQDLWSRVHENVGRMAERLSHPDKQFHYTLVENVRSVSRQLKHLNVTNDARIEELRQYIDKHLCQHEVEELRKVPTLRTAVGAHAQEVLNKMATFAKGV